MKTVAEQAGLPDNWVEVDAPIINPSRGAPPPPNPMPAFFTGSISPALQHDAIFVGTRLGTPRIPETSLMPIGLSGSAGFNSGVISKSKAPPVIPVPVSNDQLFEINGGGLGTMYSINGSVI